MMPNLSKSFRRLLPPAAALAVGLSAAAVQAQPSNLPTYVNVIGRHGQLKSYSGPADRAIAVISSGIPAVVAYDDADTHLNLSADKDDIAQFPGVPHILRAMRQAAHQAGSVNCFGIAPDNGQEVSVTVVGATDAATQRAQTVAQYYLPSGQRPVCIKGPATPHEPFPAPQ